MAIPQTSPELTSILDALPCAGLLVGLDGVVRAVKREAASWLHAAPGELIGKALVQLLPDQMVPTLGAALEEVKGGAVDARDLSIADGASAGLVRAAAVRGPGGAPTSVLLMVQPGGAAGELRARCEHLATELEQTRIELARLVTGAQRAKEASDQELWATNDELQAMNDELRDRLSQLAEAQQINERKNEFLAMLAHELRNPLAPLTSALYIIRERAP